MPTQRRRLFVVETNFGKEIIDELVDVSLRRRCAGGMGGVHRD